MQEMSIHTIIRLIWYGTSRMSVKNESINWMKISVLKKDNNLDVSKFTVDNKVS